MGMSLRVPTPARIASWVIGALSLVAPLLTTVLRSSVTDTHGIKAFRMSVTAPVVGVVGSRQDLFDTDYEPIAGTDPQLKGPLNCVPSGSQAAAYFAVRVLTDATIPTNGGCFRPVTLKLPYEINELEFIAKIGASFLILSVGPSSQVASVKDLVAAARAKPGQIVLSSSGGFMHFVSAMFKSQAGFDGVIAL